MSRYFTHGQAERLLPRVEKMLRDALSHNAEHDRCREQYQERVQKIFMTGGMVVDSTAMAELKQRAESSARALAAKVEEIHELGVQVKDLKIGLIDFPTLYKGEEVLLCWKLGEERIEFWHNLTDGFRGRKPVDAEFLANHQGSI